ncbi:polysaccharide deacetylase family protein [Aquibacillus sediminis]|uniref:polysaccharide deacetylase family protein n=1 Tax=Aquibacillus sediminis TaxID=2574734 RepID=UPI001FE3BF26|nr:polysaccharide deacetylase family protein [Aquibacillus sediminis]
MTSNKQPNHPNNMKIPIVITHKETNHKKTVVLTFDDGPSEFLPKILDILKSENVPALFFWQSQLVETHKPWQRVLTEGHVIGSHTIDHPNLSELSFDEQYDQIKDSSNKIERITQQKVTFFRPPYGQYNSNTLKIANQLGLSTIMWQIPSYDWELTHNPEQIIENVVNQLENGAIILLHELPQTVQILLALIQAIKQRGYRFVLL